MKTEKIKIDPDDLIIFQGISRKTNEPYEMIQFKRAVMFKPDYVKRFKVAGVRVFDMSELEV